MCSQSLYQGTLESSALWTLMTCRCSKTHKKKKTFSKTPLAQVGSAIENARKRNYTRNTVYWSPNNRVYRKRRVQKLRYTTIYDSHASHQCICIRRFPFTCVSCLFARHSYTTVRSCYNLYSVRVKPVHEWPDTTSGRVLEPLWSLQPTANVFGARKLRKTFSHISSTQPIEFRVA